MSEGFGSRWSRVKRDREAGIAVTEPASAAENPAALISPAAAHQQTMQAEQEVNALVAKLPSVDGLDAESDYTAFMQAKVPDALKRQALKKLFAAPQFNVMDGLDVYIDDYSVSTPIPADWYDHLPSWQAILNPKVAVITDHGYAVEPDSEEGIAVLKARAEKQRALDAQSAAGATVNESVSESAVESVGEVEINNPLVAVGGTSGTLIAPESGTESITESTPQPNKDLFEINLKSGQSAPQVKAS